MRLALPIFKDATEMTGFIEFAQNLEHSYWPIFMTHTPTSNACLSRLVDYFPNFQLAVCLKGKRIGCAKAIPFHWDRALIDLPDKGWDAIYAKGIEDYERTRKPNALCLLSITIAPSFRKLGLASLTIKELKHRAILSGLNLVVAPVRPTGKCNFPQMSFDEYLQWRRQDKEHVDPWIRTHERLGARIVKSAYRSCTIIAALDRWEAWIGHSLQGAKYFSAPGMLVPIEIDAEKGQAIYIEPNVWMVHDHSWSRDMGEPA